MCLICLQDRAHYLICLFSLSFLNFIVGFHIHNFQFRLSRQERIKPMNHITDKTYSEKNCSHCFWSLNVSPHPLGFCDYVCYKFFSSKRSTCSLTLLAFKQKWKLLSFMSLLHLMKIRIRNFNFLVLEIKCTFKYSEIKTTSERLVLKSASHTINVHLLFHQIAGSIGVFQLHMKLYAYEDKIKNS